MYERTTLVEIVDLAEVDAEQGDEELISGRESVQNEDTWEILVA
jgi:hypothetical protein